MTARERITALLIAPDKKETIRRSRKESGACGTSSQPGPCRTRTLNQGPQASHALLTHSHHSKVMISASKTLGGICPLQSCQHKSYDDLGEMGTYRQSQRHTSPSDRSQVQTPTA